MNSRVCIYRHVAHRRTSLAVKKQIDHKFSLFVPRLRRFDVHLIIDIEQPNFSFDSTSRLKTVITLCLCSVELLLSLV